MFDAASIHANPNALAPHYSRFRVTERLLLTGHSHQAWPDCGFEAQQQAWLDAAEHVDAKWDTAFAQANRVQQGYSELMNDEDGIVALGANTHDLVIRFLSALPLGDRPRLVTTDGEFHTIRRQLDRLAEEQIEIVKVPASPVDEIAGRLIDAIDDQTAAVLVSAVLFRSGLIVPGLTDIQKACERYGTQLLIDAYHALNVVPFSVRASGLENSFIVGGGYKYCQLGEGNAFLRFPAGCTLRPVITGWFSEFDTLAVTDRPDLVPYGSGPGRFAGATYDPASHYRAAAVFDFFKTHGLTPELLRNISQHQIHLLATRFDDLDLDPAVIRRDQSIPLESIAGFLVLDSPHANQLSSLLARQEVFSDFRGTSLRLGPAPYLSDDQLINTITILGECVAMLE